MAKVQLSVYLDSSLIAEIETLAIREKTSKSAVVEDAVASFLSSESNIFTRRMDHLASQLEGLERRLIVSAEMLALFIQHSLTYGPRPPHAGDGAARAAAETQGRTRFNHFLQALVTRIARGRDIIQDVRAEAPKLPTHRRVTGQP
jgi:hypothetical protein